MKKSQAILLMVLASLFWSIAGLFIKQIPWHPLVIAGLRSLISGVFLFAFVRDRRELLNRTAILGGVAYIFVAGLFVVANKLTTSTNAILLQFTAPIWVVVISGLFLKYRPNLRDVSVIVVVLFGMVLFFMGDLAMGNIYGNVLAILAGVSLAIMILIMKGAPAINPLVIPTVGNFFLFAVSLPFIFLYPPVINVPNITNILILGILQLGMGYLLFSHAVPHISSLEAALLMVIEPLFNPIWVLIFIGERPTLYAVVGGVIVVTSIVIYQVSSIRQAADTNR